jgi:hypothetical protein
MAGLKTPDEYREKAQAVRAQAVGTDNPSIRTRFLHIAQNYEMIADLIEQIGATKARLRNSN